MKKKFQWWQVNAPTKIFSDYDWLVEVMGEPDYTARWWFEQESNKYYFRSEKDAMLFELKYSDESKD